MDDSFTNLTDGILNVIRHTSDDPEVHVVNSVELK